MLRSFKIRKGFFIYAVFTYLSTTFMKLRAITLPSAFSQKLHRFAFCQLGTRKKYLSLCVYIVAVILNKAYNLVRKGFLANFQEMDMNIKGHAADILHKMGFTIRKEAAAVACSCRVFCSYYFLSFSLCTVNAVQPKLSKTTVLFSFPV